MTRRVSCARPSSSSARSAQLLRGSRREREREHLAGRRRPVHEPGEAAAEDPRLAGAGAGDHQRRAAGMGDGGALVRGEIVGQDAHGTSGPGRPVSTRGPMQHLSTGPATALRAVVPGPRAGLVAWRPWPMSDPSARSCTTRRRDPSAAWSPRPTTSSRRSSARGYLAAAPYNAVRLTSPRCPTRRWPGAASRAGSRTGVLVRADRRCMVAWTQTFTLDDGVDARAPHLLATVGLEPYEARVVRPHERTHAGPREDRLRLMRAARRQLSPVFGLYPDPEGGRVGRGRAARARPTAEVTDREGTVHRFWRVDDAGRLRGAWPPRSPDALDPDRRRPPPLRDRPRLPGGAARRRRRPRPDDRC